MNVDAVKEGMALIEQGMRKFSGGPFDYYMKCLIKAYELLLSKYAPFKPGDRVQLTRSPNIESSLGWYGSRHFLIPGAKGVVNSSEVTPDGNIRFYIVFDNESWMDDKGMVHPVSMKHSFNFFEQDLELEKA